MSALPAAEWIDSSLIFSMSAFVLWGLSSFPQHETAQFRVTKLCFKYCWFCPALNSNLNIVFKMQTLSTVSAKSHLYLLLLIKEFYLLL